MSDYVINCIHAGRISQNEYKFYECNNDQGTFAHKAVCQPYCARCKYRVPIMRDAEPMIEREPEAHQTTFAEWMKGGDSDNS